MNWTKIIPRWGGTVVDPPEQKKTDGWLVGDKPPAFWENWFRKGVTEALEETQDNVDLLETEVDGIKGEISTPDFNTIELTVLEQIKSVVDSYGGIAEFIASGVTLHQAVKNGNFANGTTIGTNWLQVNPGTFSIVTESGNSFQRFSASGQNPRTKQNIKQFKAGEKIFLKARFRWSSGSGFSNANVRLYNDDVFVSSLTTINESVIQLNQWIENHYSIITLPSDANQVYLAQSNPGTYQVDWGGVFAIPITGTPYENMTADEINARIGNTYWERLKSAETFGVASRERNLFDKSKVEFGKTVSSATGAIVSDSNFNISHYIPIKSGQLCIQGRSAFGYALYDTNKKFINGGISQSISVPQNGYIIFNIASSDNIDLVMLNEGSTALPFEEFSGSTAKVTCADPTKFDMAQLPNLKSNTIEFKDGRYRAVKRVARLSIGSGVLINTTNLTGALNGGQYYLAQSDGVVSIGSVNGTYTTTATATVYYELATQITMDESNFGNYGIEANGSLSSNNDFTEFYIDNYDIFPSDLQIQYATNLAKAVDSLKNGVIALKEFQTTQNLINLEFDARLTILE